MEDDSADSPRSNHAGTRQTGARLAIWTLTAINFLNYADRYVPSSVKSLIQTDLKLSDFETSLPSTGKCLAIHSQIVNTRRLLTSFQIIRVIHQDDLQTSINLHD